VRVIYENGYTSEWLHLSKDENGDGYSQPLVIGMGNKKNGKKNGTKNGKKNGTKNGKKNTRKKRFKEIQTLRLKK
jgi:hypothetical protein